MIGKDRLIKGNSKLEDHRGGRRDRRAGIGRAARADDHGAGGHHLRRTVVPGFGLLAWRNRARRAVAGEHGPAAQLDPRPGGRPRCELCSIPWLAQFLVEANSAIWNGFFLALYTIYSLDTLRIEPWNPRSWSSAQVVSELCSVPYWLDGCQDRLGLGPAMIVCMAGTRLAVFLIPLAQGPLWFAVMCLLIHQLLGDAC